MSDFCACGCGEPLATIKNPYARRYGKGFKPGHSNRVNPSSKPCVPLPGEAPSGACECGCGQPTSLVAHTIRSRRHFVGYPLPYCHGHGDREHGPAHHLFKGIRRTNGYVYEYAPDHPQARKGSEMPGFVFQHRLVWEQINGRFLRNEEVVHHVNGIRDDNRPENLVALTKSAHCKSHAEDHQRGCSEESRRKISEAMKRVWAERKAARS